ncbi:hypothetical protein E2C01_083842 [Portunus trituberculatus]|uniref:Uncharacterized protein n=1 Tax=Portunus trituberculatus TaxID=210409 RepID=A0A5B7J7M6_PORTR|nr:hypothetical protein [Portunus trituberculatus]
MAWKDELELNVGVNYTAHSGSKKSHDGMIKVYYCRRSSVAKTPGASCNKRVEKSQEAGSVLI